MINLVDTSNENFEVLELHPRVLVFRNVLPNIEKLYKIMKDSEESSNGKFFLKTWDQWSIFGTYSQHKDSSDEAEHGERYDLEKYFAQEVSDGYIKALSYYVKKYDINLPESAYFSGSSFSKYNPNVDKMENKMTMQYHTDFITSQKDMPGPKFFITCTMYINDDYKGGDIEFFVDNKLINHKPQAGDILIFPSEEPYYHGVKLIEDGYKFFVRNFVMVPYDGSEEWLSNQKKFGAYRWALMEQERIENEDPKNMVYIHNGERITHEQAQSGYHLL